MLLSQQSTDFQLLWQKHIHSKLGMKRLPLSKLYVQTDKIIAKLYT
jgi:hypothetical protein